MPWGGKQQLTPAIAMAAKICGGETDVCTVSAYGYSPYLMETSPFVGAIYSIVTSVAGTTRDVVEETVNFADVTLRLSDTAGIRETDDDVEKIGVLRTKERIASADLCLAVFDGTDKDFDILGLLKTLDIRKTVAVFNKSDVTSPNTAPAEDLGLPFVTMSAKSGDGIEALATEIKKITGTAHLDGTAAVYLNERQRNCALRALKHVEEAISVEASGQTIDAVGVLIDDALAALLELTGERVANRVADEIFARFCVGK
jgi:tRNA modification GTPase